MLRSGGGGPPSKVELNVNPPAAPGGSGGK
jgi:hypothetical protein